MAILFGKQQQQHHHHNVLLLLVAVLVLVSSFVQDVHSFAPAQLVRTTATRPTSTLLFAKKPAAKNKNRPSTSGFGGAAAEACPCGGAAAAATEGSASATTTPLSYMKCCGKLHKNIFAFQKATPAQVVRARYTAYAKRDIHFIIQSTHPLNDKFVGDIQHWREQIDLNCYDNFELTKCTILEETIGNDDNDNDNDNDENTENTENTATVCFVANMVQRDSRERTSFQETSTFERIGGAWLYKEGVIADPPGRETKDDEVDDGEEDGDDSNDKEEVVVEATTPAVVVEAEAEAKIE